MSCPVMFYKYKLNVQWTMYMFFVMNDLCTLAKYFKCFERFREYLWLWIDIIYTLQQANHEL